jgi:hypothetical protein
MTSLTRKLILSLAAVAAFAGASAQAATFTGASMDYGQLVATAAADQDVQVNDSTRWVNVTDGQTVRFDLGGGKSFTFNFDTWPGSQQVDLSTIAPKDVAVPNVRVYIAPNPHYLG